MYSHDNGSADSKLLLAGQERDIDDAVDLFHERTKYYRNAFLERSIAIKNHLHRPSLVYGDLRNRKRYIDARRIPLPTARLGRRSFDRTLLARRTRRRFSAEPMSVSELGDILGLGYGTSGQTPSSVLKNDLVHLRTFPSAGSLFPHELYVITLNIRNVPRLIAHYSWEDHSLSTVVRQPDFRKLKEVFMDEDDVVLSGNVVVVLTLVHQRSTRKYGPRGYRMAVLEIGAATQNISLVGESRGLSVLNYQGFLDQELAEIMDLGAPDEMPLHAIVLGKPATRQEDGGT